MFQKPDYHREVNKKSFSKKFLFTSGLTGFSGESFFIQKKNKIKKYKKKTYDRNYLSLIVDMSGEKIFLKNRIGRETKAYDDNQHTEEHFLRYILTQKEDNKIESLNYELDFNYDKLKEVHLCVLPDDCFLTHKKKK